MKGLLLRPDLCTLVFFFSSPISLLKEWLPTSHQACDRNGERRQTEKKKKKNSKFYVLSYGQGKAVFVSSLQFPVS